MYVVRYGDNKYAMNNIGILLDEMDEYMYIESNGIIDKVKSNEFLKNHTYALCKYTGDDYQSKLQQIEELYINKTEADYKTIYDIIYGTVLSENYTACNNIRCIYVSEDDTSHIELKNVIIENVYKYNCQDNNLHLGLPIINEAIRQECDHILTGYNNLIIKEEVDGYYVENMMNNNRSIPFKQLYQINTYVLDIINSKL